MAYRGFNSKVVVDCDGPLNKSECRDCGVCIDFCPTSALTKPAKEWRDMTDYNSIEKRDSLLAMISEEQRNRGFLSEESIVFMAQGGYLRRRSLRVATFYAFLSVKPQGRHVVRVCKSVPCHLKQSEMVASWIGVSWGSPPGKRLRTAGLPSSG